MNSSVPIILIAYPLEWRCYSKLSRKLDKILRAIPSFSVIYPHDCQGFITRFFSADLRVISINPVYEQDLKASHAIILDDGFSFEQLKTELVNTGINLRCLQIAITRGVNIDKKESSDIYIGRGSGFGNPYQIGLDGDDREEVIRKFQYDFDRGYLRDNFKTRLLALQGKRLGCHCKPLSCHGDVLAEYLNSYDDGL